MGPRMTSMLPHPLLSPRPWCSVIANSTAEAHGQTLKPRDKRAANPRRRSKSKSCPLGAQQVAALPRICAKALQRTVSNLRKRCRPTIFGPGAIPTAWVCSTTVTSAVRETAFDPPLAHRSKRVNDIFNLRGQNKDSDGPPFWAPRSLHCKRLAGIAAPSTAWGFHEGLVEGCGS